MSTLKHNWTREEVTALYNKPLISLIFEAGTMHRQYFNPEEVQVSSLLSIKTGGCPEDCAYCPQAARYQTEVAVHKLLDKETVLQKAKEAQSEGASRFCMGAAWREVRDNRDFDKVLDMVKDVNALGMEVCCTLGMLSESQAKRLKEAGLFAYNHNLDTSEEFYGDIISTRTYQDRMDTLQNVRKAGLTVCCGGIIGMGESENDRIALLQNLANQLPHPESVPINALISVDGTPLQEQEKVPVWDMVRTIAVAKILMPASMIRLSAGRVNMTAAEQALCFLAGANSIFAGDKLLTTPNPSFVGDQELFAHLGLQPMEAFCSQKVVENSTKNA
ncbi:MAG: biotin synthase BioB [Chitinophagales bacterium]|nr:biotin synthase BioB [Bacteroidota bacterium]MCB9042518.1 biotin synthase BioB [Chitinophagales bacterium]